MIIKLNNPRFRQKIIIFDYDWTLVIPKSGGIFPKDIDDWKFIRDNVPDIIKDYYEKGYGIYIATNQSKSMKIDQIKNVISLLNIPITICIANEKSLYKPNIDFLKSVFNNNQFDKIKLDKSFMVGDALGRTNDFSNSDLLFAENLGLKCYPPEEIFILSKDKEDEKLEEIKIEPKNTQEIIIMTGYPGSGKSTIANNIFLKNGYIIISGDIHKTSKKMIKIAISEIEQGKSIVFDSLNPSREKRAEFIDLAKKYNLPSRCIYVSTSFNEALIRNNLRPKPIPKIVYFIFKKNFELPNEDEGCEVITV